jgi:hypothetical protein
MVRFLGGYIQVDDKWITDNICKKDEYILLSAKLKQREIQHIIYQDSNDNMCYITTKNTSPDKIFYDYNRKVWKLYIMDYDEDKDTFITLQKMVLNMKDKDEQYSLDGVAKFIAKYDKLVKDDADIWKELKQDNYMFYSED